MHRIFFSALTLVSLWALVACDPPQQAAPTLSELKAPATAEVSRPAQAALLPFSEREYSFGYWLNGMRKHADDPSADVLCLESGYFGFALDMADLTEARLGTFTESLDYREALEAGAERLR